MSKKRIQLSINQALLAKAEAMAKQRYCDSISEFVEFLLRAEEGRQESDLVLRETPPPYGAKQKPGQINSGVETGAREALDIAGRLAEGAATKPNVQTAPTPAAGAVESRTKKSGATRHPTPKPKK